MSAPPTHTFTGGKKSGLVAIRTRRKENVKSLPAGVGSRARLTGVLGITELGPKELIRWVAWVKLCCVCV